MSRKAAEGIAIVVMIALVGLGSWYILDLSIDASGTPEPIAIMPTAQELAGLIFIAEDGGFFAQNGLNVTISYCDTGLACVNGMADGEAEVAASSEYPVVGMVLKQENISLVGSIDKYQGQYIVGRKDRGIEDVADLRGKKIGVARGTATEFYLGRFLYLSNIGLQDVAFVDLRPSQYVDAIGNGRVDAIIVPQVYLTPVEVQLGGDAVVWQAQGSQNAFGVLTCRSDWIASHTETVNRLLRSLLQAEEYCINHPIESKAILQRRLNYTEEYMAAAWPNHQFSLTLDQSLVAAMEDEGRWMIRGNLTTEKTIPSFRNHIHTKGLEEIKPESVNIIG
jgi:ABC-type nitrate/sulfonate/bicarbonate transport system substrate-binding protein